MAGDVSLRSTCQREMRVHPCRSLMDCKISAMASCRVLACVLLGIQGLLGFWRFKAEGSIERSVACILMTAILLAVIAAVIRIVERSKLRVRGFDTTITVAAKEASPEEISSHDPEV